MSQYVQVPQPTHGLLPDLTQKEKAVVSLGLIGVVGWVLYGDKIKRRLK